MVYRQISDLLQKKAIEELNEEPLRIEEHLAYIREWLKKQPHLNIRSDDQSLLTFLRGCKWSLQRLKEKLDYFYTIRTLLPEFFLNRDPCKDDIQEFLRQGVLCPLPKPLDTDGPRILYYDYAKIDFDNMRLITFYKFMMMTLDLLLQEDDNLVISGLICLINGTKTPLSYLLQHTPAILKQIILCVQKAYPCRIKKIIMINSDPAITMLHNTISKPFLSKKLNDRIHLYTSNQLSNAYSHIPKPLFPEDLGGTNGSCQQLAEEWKLKMESYKDWYLDDYKYINREQLRPGKSKSYNEEFNIEGTFRKLTID